MGSSKKPRKTKLDKLNIVALAESGLNNTQIADALDISRDTVKRTKQDHEILKNSNEIAIIKKGLANKFTLLTDLAVNNSTSKMNDMNAYQSAIIAKIALESSRLIEGQSTSNISLDAQLRDITKDNVFRDIDKIEITPADKEILNYGLTPDSPHYTK